LLWGTVQPLIHPGDLVLVQLAHNDKTTDEATYRANLETLVAGIRDRGGRPVLVTPIVRRWFNADGTLNNNTALLVNGLGVDLPGVDPLGRRDRGGNADRPHGADQGAGGIAGSGRLQGLYLYNEKKDNTHTSAHGATVYAGLVRDVPLTAIEFRGSRHPMRCSRGRFRAPGGRSADSSWSVTPR
jgi:hypothetical protein